VQPVLLSSGFLSASGHGDGEGDGAPHNKRLISSADWRSILSVPDANGVSHNPPKPPPLVDF
jgi:hypothetical protein